ncbi:MAG: aminotransferase class III-fold pyridoxal phosphate-dependent enzyme [Parvularculaceae bacterium]|nr:aminotransferase class III-fold pyridoxal phosphate-dependent enzyme [Parvularculaceae bacterium]
MIEKARRVLKSEFGLDAALSPLPGEYDLNFAATGDDGTRYVLKVMRAECERSFIEMQTRALDHLRERGFGAHVPAIVRTLKGEAITRIETTGNGMRIAWLITWMPGDVLESVPCVSPRLAASIGALLGRMDRALDDFDHPELKRPLKWNLTEAGWIANSLHSLTDEAVRNRVGKIAARFEAEIAPQLSRLPKQAIYNDANPMNIFVDRRAGAATGVIDFGDMIAAPRICELAIAVAYAMMGPGDALARGAALAGAYDGIAHLTQGEISLLPALIETRLAVSITNAAIQKAQNPDNKYLQISARPAMALLDYIGEMGLDDIGDAFRGARGAAARTAKSVLIRRRRISPSNQSLFYETPLRLVRGERHFVYDDAGAQYLDVYNNVPHVGHAHPRVVEAVAGQMGRIATNTRYLQDIHVDYAERMLAKTPPNLSKIIFLNSASEANELALRLARAFTGARDMIVMEHCYHGNTTGAMDISPYKFSHPKSRDRKADWVHVTPQPDVFRGSRRGADAASGYINDARRTIERALDCGRGAAGFISESLPSVGGQIVLPDGYLEAAYKAIREAGGVAIADDVQTGLGRLGRWFFGFEQQGVAPDILVLGKPIGNGFPLAAVAMTEEIAAAFADGPEFFSTFGGSSASCAAGLAVLDALDDEGLQENARIVGEYLIDELERMQARQPLIGDIRGFGFFLGVDLVTDRDTRAAATDAARFVKNRLRDRHILLGTEGPEENVLKIRPPMTFDRAAADRLLEEIDAALAAAPI